MQTNFQDGVSSIYDALISAGLTPSSTDLADIITAIDGGGAIYYLGCTNQFGSTTVNVIDYLPDIYTELTSSNFIVQARGIYHSAGGSNTSGGSSSCLTKSYSESTGVLTVGLYASGGGNNNGGYFDIYCYYGLSLTDLTLVT